MKARNIVMIAVGVTLAVAATVVTIVAVVTDDSATLMGVCWPEDPVRCSSDDMEGECNMEPTRYEVDGAEGCPPMVWPEGYRFPLLVSLYEPNFMEADPGEAAALRSAIDAVNGRLGFDALEFDPEWEADDPTCYDQHAICVRMNVAHDATWMEHAGTARHSWNQVGFGCSVTTSNTGTSDLTHDVLRHELLHCLGLAHDIEDDGSIMFPIQRHRRSLANAARIRDRDRDELRRQYDR